MVIYHVLFLRCYIIITFWHFVHTNINIYSNAPTAPSPVEAKTKLLRFHCIHYITLQDTINSVRIRESLLFNLLSTFESHLLSPAKFRPHGVQYSQFNSYIFFLWHRTTDQQSNHLIRRRNINDQSAPLAATRGEQIFLCDLLIRLISFIKSPDLFIHPFSSPSFRDRVVWAEDLSVQLLCLESSSHGNSNWSHKVIWRTCGMQEGKMYCRSFDDTVVVR